MLESLTVNQIIEMGFPYFMVIVFARVLNGLWKDLWPWVKEYASLREQRWEKQFSVAQQREMMMQQQAGEFLTALSTFQNGFAKASTEQHNEILKVVQEVVESLTQYRTANISMIELLVSRLETHEGEN